MYPNELDTLDEFDKFLGKPKLPKQTQEETENLHRPTMKDWINNFKKTTHKEKPKVRLFRWWILPDTSRRNKSNTLKTLQKLED